MMHIENSVLSRQITLSLMDTQERTTQQDLSSIMNNSQGHRIHFDDLNESHGTASRVATTDLINQLSPKNTNILLPMPKRVASADQHMP